MRLTTLSLFGNPHNTRELLVWGVADRPFMTMRQMRNFLKDVGSNMSFQAVCKQVKLLIEDGQVKRLENGVYCINPAWIEALRGFCDVMERRLSGIERDGKVSA